MKKTLLLFITIFSLCIRDVQALSVGELITREPRRLKVQRGWVPGVKVLDLTDMNIDSLKGLEDIPGIDSVTRLYLNNNAIHTIEPGDFAAAVNLTALSLSGNDLETVEPNAFAGLKNLKVLNLSNNALEIIPPEGLNGMPGLRFLGMSKNPMTNPKGSLQTQVPKAFITTLPINQKNLTKWAAWLGSGIVVLVAAVAGIAAIKKERAEKREWERFAKVGRPLSLSKEREDFLKDLTPEKIENNPKIVHKILADEMPFLNSEQLQAIKMKELTREQIEKLEPNQISDLTQDQALTLVNMGTFGRRHENISFSIPQLNALISRLPEKKFEFELSTLKIKQLREEARSPQPHPRTPEEGSPVATASGSAQPKPVEPVATASGSAQPEEGSDDDDDRTMARHPRAATYTPAYMPALKKDDLLKETKGMKRLSEMSIEDLRELGENISYYPANLISKIGSSIKFLDEDQLKILTKKQLEALTQSQVNIISRFRKIKSIDISGLSADAVKGIPNRTILNLNSEQKNALRERRDDLTEAQQAALGKNNHNSL
jgi:Leucine-rich repeat (LRR) protein